MPTNTPENNRINVLKSQVGFIYKFYMKTSTGPGLTSSNMPPNAETIFQFRENDIENLNFHANLIATKDSSPSKDALVQPVKSRDRTTILLMQVSTFLFLLFIPVLFFSSGFKKIISIRFLVSNSFTNEMNFPKDGSWTLHEHNHAISGSNGTCMSIRERYFYYPPSELTFSPALKNRLREYEKMHKRCVSGVRDWDEHFKILEDGKQDCRYIVWVEITSGLGNKFGSLLSAFTYALLTNRALLVDTSNNMAGLICNPFPSSSWWLQSDFILGELQKSQTLGQYLKEIESNDGKSNGIEKNSLIINMQHWYSSDDAQLYCEYTQSTMDDVIWTSFDSNQNTIPAFYFVPNFREYLNELFPDRALMTHLSRYLLNPTNAVWGRITRIYDGYIRNADSKIGLQIRVGAEYDLNVSERITACLGENNLIPDVTLNSQSHSIKKEKIALDKPKPITNIFIASLDIEYYAYLKEFYGQRPSYNNRLVTVHTESTGSSSEDHNLNANQIALSEIWLLSMSDTLLITYHSTFGYLASSLAGKETYFMNICEFSNYNEKSRWKLNDRPVCERAWSYNGCFHCSPRHLKCRGKTVFKKEDASTWLPYIRDCQDESYGIVLIPSL